MHLKISSQHRQTNLSRGLSGPKGSQFMMQNFDPTLNPVPTLPLDKFFLDKTLLDKFIEGQGKCFEFLKKFC